MVLSMEDKVVTNSYMIVSEVMSDSMYFGVSCAFFALRLLSISDVQDERLSEVRDKMLRGSAQLLGLLMWRVQKEGRGAARECELFRKLEIAEREVRELKRLRHDDAKANEKVVSIFAAQEQSWFNERKKLRQHIGALMSGLRVFEKKKEQAIAHWNEKMREMEHLVQSKDNALENMEQKLKECEEKLREAENVAEELREKAKIEAQQHSSEILKHRTAFIELVSNQRQLDADMGRALRQVEATKREFNIVFDQKEDSVLMVQKLSAEIVKMHKDLEQKDKILSAMLRKSKLDISEKQMLVKEIKLSKAKRKQAELETERWKVVSESKKERHSLRSMLEKANSKFEIALNEMNTSTTGTSHLEYENPEFRNEFVQYSFEENVKNLADMKQLEAWVRSEEERYAAIIEQRHHLEIDAFVEQLRAKDEKLENYQWRLLSMEIESKRLDSHLDELNKEITQLRHNNLKLEALLSAREEESASVKEQFASQLRLLHSQMNNLKSKAEEKNKKRETSLVESTQVKGAKNEVETSSCTEITDQSHQIVKVQSPDMALKIEKNVLHEGTSEEASTCASPVEVNGADKLVISTPSQASSTNNNSQWRMDLQALGVSYKIKRLKQQLLMLERFTGKHDNGEDQKDSIDEEQSGMKGYLSLMSLLNKQVGRYQSLQGKVDELCQKMHENDLDGNGRHGDSDVARTKDKSKTLENFLDETFQLQRYMVATGQRLMEILPKISPGIVGISVELEKCASFDMNRFTEFIRTLFQEVQRGLEVRIARMIGDLEGTLACDGMIHLRR